MTYILKAATDEVQRAEWRDHASRAAHHLKAMKFPTDEQYCMGFAFDDGFYQLRIEVALIQQLNEEALGTWVFEAMLAQVANAEHPMSVSPPANEAAKVDTPIERCVRLMEPDYKEACPNNAEGGLKITLRPGEAVEKRYGLGSLLTFIMDLPVCAGCAAKSNVMAVTDQELRARVAKVAQQNNNGILVDWKRTVIELVPWADPQLIKLRDEMRKAADAARKQAAEGQVAEAANE